MAGVAYKAKNGAIQYKPSLKAVERMDRDMQGWCLACGSEQDGCEPDARKYKCEGCGKDKVYGAAELALMGLVV